MGQKVGEAPAAHGSSINGFRISVPQQLKENFLINYKKCHPRSARPLGPDLPSHRDEVILKEAIHQRTFFVSPLKKKFRQLAFPPSLLHTPTPFHIHSKKAKIQYCGSGIRCLFDPLLKKFNSLMRIRDPGCKKSDPKHCKNYKINSLEQCCGSGMFNPDLGSEFFPSRIRMKQFN
jgi:hypothetical protein